MISTLGGVYFKFKNVIFKTGKGLGTKMTTKWDRG